MSKRVLTREEKRQRKIIVLDCVTIGVWLIGIAVVVVGWMSK